MRRQKQAVLAMALGVLALVFPGRAAAFDYFILSLSWTPSWCAQEGDARADGRCDPGAGHGWLVHGLWPQFRDGGWPEYCQTGARPASRAQTAAMVDIMGSSGLAWHQWRKHGSCAQVSAHDYFEATRAAFASVQLPAEFMRIDADRRIDPKSVEAAFLEKNQQFTAEMMVVTCRRDAVAELRICLDKSLQPTNCDENLQARACPASRALLPAPR